MNKEIDTKIKNDHKPSILSTWFCSWDSHKGGANEFGGEFSIRKIWKKIDLWWSVSWRSKQCSTGNNKSGRSSNTRTFVYAWWILLQVKIIQSYKCLFSVHSIWSVDNLRDLNSNTMSLPIADMCELCKMKISQTIKLYVSYLISAYPIDLLI